MKEPTHTESTRLPVVGVIPMAGQATRLADLTCSKEILPVRFNQGTDASRSEPKAVCEHCVFPADRPEKVDMLELGPDHQIRQLAIKPAETSLKHTWAVAVWTPVFTEFMHAFLESHQDTADRSPELYIGDVVRAAIQSGMDVQGIPVSNQPFMDIGTREDLERASD